MSIPIDELTGKFRAACPLLETALDIGRRDRVFGVARFADDLAFVLRLCAAGLSPDRDQQGRQAAGARARFWPKKAKRVSSASCRARAGTSSCRLSTAPNWKRTSTCRPDRSASSPLAAANPCPRAGCWPKRESKAFSAACCRREPTAINGYGFDVDLEPAIEIKPGYVGVQRRLLGSRQQRPVCRVRHRERDSAPRSCSRACTTSTPRNSRSCPRRSASFKPASAPIPIQRTAPPSPSPRRADSPSAWIARSSGKSVRRTCLR